MGYQNDWFLFLARSLDLEKSNSYCF